MQSVSGMSGAGTPSVFINQHRKEGYTVGGVISAPSTNKVQARRVSSVGAYDQVSDYQWVGEGAGIEDGVKFNCHYQ